MTQKKTTVNFCKLIGGIIFSIYWIYGIFIEIKYILHW